MLLKLLGIQSRVETFQYWKRENCDLGDLSEIQPSVENEAAFFVGSWGMGVTLSLQALSKMFSKLASKGWSPLG